MNIKKIGLKFFTGFRGLGGRRITRTRKQNYILLVQPYNFCLTFLNFFYVAKVQPLFGNYSDSAAIKETERVTEQSLIKQSDDLFSIGKFEESFKVLEPLKDSDNAEVLWRISRGLYNMSKQKNTPQPESAYLIKDAYKCIERAVLLDENNYAVHKWMAILCDAKSSLEGIKAKISALPTFKYHLMLAIKLNPKDATSLYMLGQYMYNLADLSKVQKFMAKTLFGSPPEGSFEEAFYFFSKAEEVDPNFYSANLLMLGKTSLKLKRIEAARYWLKCAIAYPVRTDEDEAVRLEAEELLNSHPAVKAGVKDEETHNVHQ